MSNKSWIVFKGGRKANPRQRGPGIYHQQGESRFDTFDSTDLRAVTFHKNAIDAPKKASRTMPASWGQPFGGSR